MTDALTRALTARGRPQARTVRIMVTQASPLLVLLPDGSTVPALPVQGLTYTVGGAGVAFLAEGLLPVVLPTA